MITASTAGLVLQYIEGAADLASVVRASINSYDAGRLTPDAGMDLAGLVAELIFLSQSLTIASAASEAGVGVSESIAELCFLLVYGTLTFFTLIECMNGVGYPCSGGEFEGGYSDFGHIHEILNDAQPDSGKWSGAGAVKYSNLNKKLCDLVDAMQEADAKIAGIVHRQANQVQQARVAVAGAAMGLVGVLLLTATLSGRTAASLQKDVAYFREKFGFAAAAGEGQPLLAEEEAGAHSGSTGKWFGLDGWVDIWLPYIVLLQCIAALATALACFLDLIAQGSFNAGDMQDQIDAYSDAHRDAADILDGLAGAVVTRPGAAQSTVSRYWENLVVADDADALMGVSKTVGIVNAPADNRVPVGVFAGDGVALGASALAMSVPEPQPPPLAGPTQAAPGQSSGAVNMLSEEVFAPAHRGGGVDRHVPPLALAAWRQAASATKPVTKKAASAEAVTGQAVSGPAAIMENGDDQQAAPGPRYPSGVPGEVVTVGAEQLLGPAWVNGRASSEGADLPSPVAHRGQIT